MAKNSKVEEMLAKIEALQKANEELQAKLNAEVEAKMNAMKASAGVQHADRRQQMLVALLNGPISTPKIATTVGVDPRDVSSYLTYLRQDGFALGKDEKGWHDLKTWSADFIRFSKDSKEYKRAFDRFNRFDGMSRAEIKALIIGE